MGKSVFPVLLVSANEGIGLTPVHFFSHGSTMMLGEESESADYWKKCGDEALARKIKGVVIMVSIVQLTTQQLTTNYSIGCSLGLSW
jgi:aromatic ring-opening dioxygenase catalytic subunit (LigB family)